MQSGRGYASRRPVFWLASSIVNISEGNGAASSVPGWKVANTTLGFERAGVGHGGATFIAALPGSRAGDLDKPAASFVGVKGRDEIWSIGLRNPFRFSFDGDNIAIGDVGQSAREEVNIVSIATAKGADFGWPVGGHGRRAGVLDRVNAECEMINAKCTQLRHFAFRI